MTTPDDDPAQALHDLRILIADDEMTVAMALSDYLSACGCSIITAGSLSKALNVATTEALDGALLDINLRGERVYPVAEALDARAIPFIFLTGYSADHVQAPWEDRPVLEKPMNLDVLKRTIAAAFNVKKLD